jgi:competence protein ComGC
MMTKKNKCFRLTHHAVVTGLLVLGIVVILCMPQMNKASHAQGSPSNIGMYNAMAMASVAEGQTRAGELKTTADKKELITTANIKVDEDEKGYEETENTEE